LKGLKGVRNFNLGVKLAHIAKIGKVFLVGQGILYPVQKGILKVDPSTAVAKRRKIQVAKLGKKSKKS